MGFTAVAVLSVSQVANGFIGVQDLTATSYVGRIAVWVVSALAYGWAFFALRRSEERRAAAEAERDDERVRRLLADEHAEIAAHLHDSALQTLALVQRDAHDPDQVRLLARRQERELRSFIDRMASPFEHSFRARARGVVGEVEEMFGLRVKAVFVGDCEIDERHDALIHAAREALVNAAKHAGEPDASLLCEVREKEVCVVIRDRGVGFDPSNAFEQRGGLGGSIIARMERAGGTAAVSSAPGRGTEIELCLPQEPAAAQ